MKPEELAAADIASLNELVFGAIGIEMGGWGVASVYDALAEIVRRAEEARSALDTLRAVVAKTSAEVDTMLGLPNDIARRQGYLAGLEAAVWVLESGEMPDEVRRG